MSNDRHCCSNKPPRAPYFNLVYLQLEHEVGEAQETQLSCRNASEEHPAW